MPNLNVPAEGSKLSAFSDSGMEKREAEEHFLELRWAQTRVEPVVLDVVEGTQQVCPHALFITRRQNCSSTFRIGILILEGQS